MPALPWTTIEEIDPSTEYVAMASRLPLRRHRSIPGFMRSTSQIRQQLATTKGLVGYSLNAQLIAKRFWTFSLWIDHESLGAFAASDPHRQITQDIAPRMGPTWFDTFTLQGNQAPLAWDEIIARWERSAGSSS